MLVQNGTFITKSYTMVLFDEIGVNLVFHVISGNLGNY